MKILLIATAYNSLTQRVHVELHELGHEISVELALNEAVGLAGSPTPPNNLSALTYG